MSRFLRYRVEGGTYFFTVVTHDRRPFLTTEIARTGLRSAIKSVQAERAFALVAIVLLPDHLHCVLELPRGDCDYSTRWRLIKSRFTKYWLERDGTEGLRRASLRSKGERAVWQRRFYEHTVRDEDDLERCVDYIHWNPVKHEFVSRVRDYPWSSFHRFVSAKHYEIDWGGENPTPDFEFPE
jgi:putative transposase